MTTICAARIFDFILAEAFANSQLSTPHLNQQV